MATAAVVAAALTDHSARSKGLYLGGVDVAKEPGSPGNLTGTPIDTVHVTEAGPGGVSSLEFVVDDPRLQVTVAEGMDVRFVDLSLDYPIFAGWVQSYGIAPDFGDQGRRITVQATGVEALLDWSVTAIALTFAAGAITNPSVQIQSIVANAVGIGPLRAFSDGFAGLSYQTAPIWGLDGAGVNAEELTIPAGTTLREAIRLVYTSLMGGNPAEWPLSGVPLAVTVDFTYGLRVWEDRVATPPVDYTGLAIVDTVAGPSRAEGLSYDVDAQGVVRGVLVRWAGTPLLVSDGSGKIGPIATLSDTSILSFEGARTAGIAYLASFSSGLRGTFHQDDRAGSGTIRAGSIVTLTDARADLSASPFRIGQVEKSFNPSGRENWVVTFGGLPPSGARLIRRLTRLTLS